jgi:hypothetical protein
MGPETRRLVGLFEAYGFEKEHVFKQQWLVRFRKGNQFVDLWEGRKGLTVGVYNPRTQRVWFERQLTHEKIENILIKINYAK